MSNIEILTKGYADSVFASGPVVKEITSSDGSVSVFVDGPKVDLTVKSGGGSSFKFISEDPSRSTLNLGQGGDISNNARLIYIGSPGYTHELQTMGSSIRICGGGDTSDMWDTELDVDNNGVSIKTGYSGEYFQARPNKITIGGDVYGNITSVFVNGPAYFSNNIYDKDGNKITGGSGSGWDGTIDTGLVSITGENRVSLMSGSMAPLVPSSSITLDGNNIDITVTGSGSLYVNGPVKFADDIFDKNDQEITGGGSASLPHIKDDADGTIFMAGPAVIKVPVDWSIPADKNLALIFETEGGNERGSIGFVSDGAAGIDYFGISTPDVYASGAASIYVRDYMGSTCVGLKIGDQDCQLSKNDLRKLREILDAHS